MHKQCVFGAARRFGFIYLLGLMLVGTRTGHSQTLTDDFSKYPKESDAAPAWEPNAAGWSVSEGGLLGDDGMSIWRAAPWGSMVQFGCDVTVLQELGGDWLTAGIGVQIDEQDYWALNLVTAPEKQGRRHSTEMQEMLNGAWLAQGQAGTRLQAMPSEGSGFNWQVGETYRLEVSLTGSNITGQILQGTETVSRFGYNLGDPDKTPAVRLGIPMVRANGLRARFDNAKVTVHAPAAAPVKSNNIAPWISRPGKPMAKGTGYFRTLEKDGRWWLLDPEGKPFFDVGTDHVNYNSHWCEALGYAPYHKNVEAKYGNEAEWGKSTLKRLKEWNFNCLPAGHSPSLRHQGLAHIEFASFGTSFAQRDWICRPIHWTGFPDVFSPRWESDCRMAARRIAAKSKEDPWCIGTFLDNELEWYGKNGHLVNEVFQLAEDRPAKKAFYAWLINRFGSVAEMNRSMGTSYADERAFLSSTNAPKPSAELGRVQDAFLSVIAERYFAVASKAMREADPNHLVLGCRFAGQVPRPVLEAAGKFNDVFTINTYPRVDFESAWNVDGTGGSVEGTPRMLFEIYGVVKKPMMITEWSFPALDSGLPCKHGAGMRVDTQEQKAACYRIFANAMVDLPFMVGYHYFMWADEPALGISSTFPEDSNYGLVNEKDEPYEVFTRIVKEVNAGAARRHERSSPSGVMALAATPHGIEISNTNGMRSFGNLRLIQQGKSRAERVVLKPGESRKIPMPTDAPWCAELQNWDGTKQRALGGKLRPERFTLLNTSAEALSGVPVILEERGVVFAATMNLAPGEDIGMNPVVMRFEKRTHVALAGTNTIWICSGKTGALFDEIRSGDLSIGRLVFAVHQKINGRSYWTESAQVLSLESAEQPDAWVLEAEVENPASNELDAPAGYRARVQAIVFKQTGLALVRPLWVESLDARDWQLVEAYWFCRSEIGGSSVSDVVGGPGVPNYYRDAQFITDRNTGGCFGSLGQSSGWQVYFWTNPEGGIHPDSRFSVEREMRRGDRWNPKDMPFLWVYASDKTDDWKQFARMSQESAQVVIRAK